MAHVSDSDERAVIVGAGEDERIPLIDVGTLALLRRGGADVKPAPAGFDGLRVRFADGSAEAYDAVVAATGFRPACEELLRDVPDATTPDGAPRQRGGIGTVGGLYFCGFRLAPTGMLREIGIEARRIARHIARRIGAS